MQDYSSIFVLYVICITKFVQIQSPRPTNLTEVNTTSVGLFFAQKREKRPTFDIKGRGILLEVCGRPFSAKNHFKAFPAHKLGPPRGSVSECRDAQSNDTCRFRTMRS